MDSKAAETSVADIGREIADLGKQREKLVAFIEKDGASAQMENLWHSKLRSLAQNTLSSLKSFSKQMYAMVIGKPKDEDGNYVDIKEYPAVSGEFNFDTSM
jgi:hypothetical protein